jgi:hypothetical protein
VGDSDANEKLPVNGPPPLSHPESWLVPPNNEATSQQVLQQRDRHHYLRFQRVFDVPLEMSAKDEGEYRL